MDKKRIIVGISGASGMPLALELLRQLKGCREQTETHLIYTDGAVQTLRRETGQKPEQLEEMADYVHDSHNLGAAPGQRKLPNGWNDCGSLQHENRGGDRVRLQ